MPSTGEFIGRRVGRFTITSHLATGGMAELFIAKQEAVGGFEKDLVLKMLQNRYAENERVVEMFLNEARLAAKLNHQNIVHVYDVDESDGVRYIAMEYILGETLTDIIRRSIARGSFLPLEHAIHIVSETAAGLAYAHDRRDAEGRPARIVHRDVSPSNILVTYEGLTKIVDFGIARVQDQIREESGMRPGKVSYMAPEQVKGEGADHRSDIFSLGIILYEITVGRRLWRGPAEQVMRRIVEEQIPPPTYVRRDYPPALELIVMKALERRAVDRYQSAADLQNELNEFMEEAGLKSGARRLSQYMKELFASTDEQSAEDMVEVGPLGTAGEGTNAGAAEEDDAGEDLDFDRRASLTMRMEARSEGLPRTGVGAPPVPATINGPGSGPAGGRREPEPSGRRVDARPANPVPVPASVPGDDSLPPVPASAMGRAGSRVPPAPGRRTAQTASGSIRAAAPESLTPIPLFQAVARPGLPGPGRANNNDARLGQVPPRQTGSSQIRSGQTESSDLRSSADAAIGDAGPNVGAVIAAADAHRSAPRSTDSEPPISSLLTPAPRSGLGSTKSLIWIIATAVIVVVGVVVFLVAR